MEPKLCGCKGIRKCLLCEPPENQDTASLSQAFTLVQCYLCGQFLLHQPKSATKCASPCRPRKISSPTLSCQSMLEVFPGGAIPDFHGVTVVQEFINEDEEMKIISGIDQCQWVESQSGRRKQDYGPKINFKRQKIKIGGFHGLPPFTQALVTKMRCEVEGMEDFIPVEVCNLDYHPERGASIDPHIDDKWLWGERLITLNLLSHTNLTFSLSPTQYPHIEIFMPRRSLVIVAGNARYHWQHSIQRGHVTSRRVGVTIRELSEEFLPGGSSYIPVGKDIMERADIFKQIYTSSE